MSGAVRAVANELGRPVRFVKSIRELPDLLAEVDRLFIDLQSADLDMDRLDAMIKTRAENGSVTVPVQIVMYAQHVLETLLQSARERGIGTVMTRGQFSKSLQQLMEP